MRLQHIQNHVENVSYMPCAACGKGRPGKKAVNAADLVQQLSLPSPHEWGPSLWTILHVAAERAGRNAIPMLQADEVRELEMLVRSFPFTLPCATCQQHAGEYLRTHPINWRDARGEAGTELIRRWFYNFHDHVNQSKETPTESPAYELIPGLYGSYSSLANESSTITKYITMGINFNIIKHDAAVKFRRHLGALRGFIGL